MTDQEALNLTWFFVVFTFVVWFVSALSKTS